MKVIIVGAGEVGFHIARHLAVENKDVVVIDRNPEALRRVSEHIDVQTVVGSGGSPLVLEEAGVKEAEILLAVTDSDETNLVACLVANVVSPSTKKLARIRDADYDAYVDTFRDNPPHIDTLINPETEVVKSISQMMNFPGAADVGDFAEGRVKFVGIYLEEGAKVVDIPLVGLAAQIGKKMPLIAAVVRDEKLTIPRGNFKLAAGDLVYFITEEERLLDILEVFEKQREPVRRVMIIGGGQIGFRLAALLEKRGIHCKLIDRNPDRCASLADTLNKVVVICGDGSDQSLLEEENIQDMDAVVSLTSDEETNILCSLLAKRMGARKTITKISKFSYFPLMSAIGLEQVVSPRLSAINSILQHIRRGKVLAARSIKEAEAEVMEAVAMETSEIVGKPLSQLELPKGSLVTAIIREKEVVIPSGESVIAPGDRIIIFAVKDAIPRIEKILAVKLEFF
ncbi:MAG: Trk system potassium transporter TrkA [Desulfobacterales bacterium]